MKPRLSSAHWTEEDMDIWERAENRLGVHRARRIIESGVDADRRDADLMYMLSEWGFWSVRVKSEAGLAIYPVPAVHGLMRKRPERWHYKLDIRYFA